MLSFLLETPCVWKSLLHFLRTSSNLNSFESGLASLLGAPKVLGLLCYLFLVNFRYSLGPSAMQCWNSGGMQWEPLDWTIGLQSCLHRFHLSCWGILESCLPGPPSYCQGLPWVSPSIYWGEALDQKYRPKVGKRWEMVRDGQGLPHGRARLEVPVCEHKCPQGLTAELASCGPLSIYHRNKQNLEQEEESEVRIEMSQPLLRELVQARSWFPCPPLGFWHKNG